ncbi:GTP-binding protein [Rhodococcoides fascians]|uniref:GTP-binding protein n=1 Tax=Rhodococcoides fascians TaxID=1828 RepID=UPI00117B6106|nr:MULTISPECIES: GTP-binding protein [Rhodococcus]
MTKTKFVELSYGCTCCTLREDLVETVGAPALERKWRSCRIGESQGNELPVFGRSDVVVIQVRRCRTCPSGVP